MNVLIVYIMYIYMNLWLYFCVHKANTCVSTASKRVGWLQSHHRTKWDADSGWRNPLINWSSSHHYAVTLPSSVALHPNSQVLLGVGLAFCCQSWRHLVKLFWMPLEPLTINLNDRIHSSLSSIQFLGLDSENQHGIHVHVHTELQKITYSLPNIPNPLFGDSTQSVSNLNHDLLEFYEFPWK